jgi:hypothetical protein
MLACLQHFTGRIFAVRAGTHVQHRIERILTDQPLIGGEHMAAFADEFGDVAHFFTPTPAAASASRTRRAFIQ